MKSERANVLADTVAKFEEAEETGRRLADDVLAAKEELVNHWIEGLDADSLTTWEGALELGHAAKGRRASLLEAA